MNISIKRLSQNDGSGLDERPSYVSEALTVDRKVAFRKGKPIVEPPSDVDTDVKLGDDVGPLYDHYIRGENLLLPTAGTFLSKLFDAEGIQCIEGASEELNTDAETVRKAAKLHGVDTPVESKDSEGSEGDTQLKLPSGESIPFDPLHPLPLSQLLSDGMSVEEISLYLSEQSGESYTPAEVREAAQEYNFLSGGGSEENSVIPREEQTATIGGEPHSTPW